MKILKWFLIIVGGLILLGLLAFTIGKLLPVKHVTSQTKEFQIDKTNLWNTVRNFKEYPKWRSTVKRLEIIDESSWIEYSPSGDKLTFGIVEELPSEKFVTKILGDDLPFGGEWTLEISGIDNQAVLKITEKGEVYNPIYRFFGLFMDETATMKQYHADLETYFIQLTQ